MASVTDVKFPPQKVRDEEASAKAREANAILEELVVETRAVRIGLELMNNLNLGKLLGMARED